DPQFVRQQDQTNSSLLSLGGGPRRANNYTIDGVPITDMRNRAVFIPNIESVQEVRVQVSTYDAEMGRTGGGVFNTTGKSGSNDWHGAGYYQTRPSFASSQLFFERKAKAPKADTYYRLFGGSFGGPIIKNRTFFWATSEGYRTLTTRNASLILPTAAELGGDFLSSLGAQRTFKIPDSSTGNCAGAPGTVVPLTNRDGSPALAGQIYNPLTAQSVTRCNPFTGRIESAIELLPFSGNAIPVDRINPVA